MVKPWRGSQGNATAEGLGFTGVLGLQPSLKTSNF